MTSPSRQIAPGSRSEAGAATPFGFVVVRTPLLAFGELAEWSRGLSALEADDAEVAQALAADLRLLRQRLHDLLERPEVAEALAVASPSLVAGLDEWKRDPESKKGRRAEQALVRYFVRMTTRATPFGLFSGCSVGQVGERSELRLSAIRDYRRRTRLDTDYLERLCDELGRDPALRAELRYRPNSSLYRSGGRLRYAEARVGDGQRTYHLVAVDPDDFVDQALVRAGEGATPAELAEAVCAADPDGEVSREEAEGFVGELIDSQLLVSDLAPPVTTLDALTDLLELLQPLSAAAPAHGSLEAVRQEIAQLDRLAPGDGGPRPAAIAARLAELPAKVDRSRLLQVDMIKPAAVTIGPEVAAELARGVATLRRLDRPQASDDGLDAFRESFVERWGDSRWVPLTTALDEELGIGFQAASGDGSSPLLAGLDLPVQGEDPPLRWSPVDLLLSAKVSEALSAGRREVELTEADLAGLATGSAGAPRPLPDAYEVMASLAASSPEALAEGEFQILLRNASGPSGARLTSRFCHADEELRRQVEELLRAEERLEPDAVFAEIVHLPQGRVGNVLSRPVLRRYEIPYLGRGGGAEGDRIPVSDLRVTVSSRQVLLSSARLGQRVIPRLTSAHNYANRSQGLYRFLANLQNQGRTPAVSWSWGVLDAFPFLPRVRAGRVVLARARWRIRGDEVRQLDRSKIDDRWRRVQAWRQERELPRWVVLPDGDNELVVDLDNPLTLDAFFSIVRERQQVHLLELFPGPDQLAASGPEGRFVHELVVPFVRRREPPAPSERPLSPSTDAPGASPSGAAAGFGGSVQRSFPPGSEWLYAKLYTGSATADRVLVEMTERVVRPALNRGSADAWFFLRLGDPEWHVRLRLHGEPARLREEVLPALRAASAPLLAAGQVWKLQLDTYDREVERYGGPAGIALAERIFEADSDAAVELVELTAGDAGADARWRLGLAGCAFLLDALGLEPPRQVAVLERMAAGFAAEHGVDAPLRKQLAARLRTERKPLEALLTAGEDAGHPLAPGLAVLSRRSRRIAPVAAELARRAAAGRLTSSLDDLAPSYLHMWINRLLRSSARAHEMVIYDFLHRLLLARARRIESERRRARA